MVIGDFVKGLPGSPHPIANENMELGFVKEVCNKNLIMVKILEHIERGYVGFSYKIRSEYFQRLNDPYFYSFNADLRHENFSNENLSGICLAGADLRGSCFRRANLIGADFSFANLDGANFTGANLDGANFKGANLSVVDLSGSKGLMSAIEFIDTHFERCKDGFIVYKVFGSCYPPNPDWIIKIGSIIEEVVNPNRQDSCGCGINVAPLEWVLERKHSDDSVYKLLIRWEWLPGVVVPYNSDGKIRCEKAEILGTV